MNKRFYVLLSIIVSGAPGCSAVTTAIEHRNLVVENKMSDTVFLDPSTQRTIFLQIRNTTDQQDFDIDATLHEALAAKGYRITSEPNQAHYLLQVNVLQVGLMEKNAMYAMLQQGFNNAALIGATAYGAGAGALAGSMSSMGALSGLGYGALIAAPVALVADAFVKNNNYAAITDVQISERTSTRVTDRTNQSLKQGSRGTRNITAEETTNLKTYQTRVVSSADQVNLELVDALPGLRAGITRSIAGIF